MTYVPTMRELCGLDLDTASKFGMPHIGGHYNGAGLDTYHRTSDACTICGRPATNLHHDPPRSKGFFVLQTKWGAFVLRPALIALCGSGTTGCHNDFHGGSRYKARWIWHSDEAAEKWWSGWFLSHGYQPHDPRLFEHGHWEIEDKLTGRLLTRDARFIEGTNHE